MGLSFSHRACPLQGGAFGLGAPDSAVAKTTVSLQSPPGPEQPARVTRKRGGKANLQHLTSRVQPTQSFAAIKQRPRHSQPARRPKPFASASRERRWWTGVGMWVAGCPKPRSRGPPCPGYKHDIEKQKQLRLNGNHCQVTCGSSGTCDAESGANK